jgi:hypothetical protein
MTQIIPKTPGVTLGQLRSGLSALVAQPPPDWWVNEFADSSAAMTGAQMASPVDFSQARYASLMAFAQSRGADCGRDSDGKFGSGNKCQEDAGQGESGPSLHLLAGRDAEAPQAKMKSGDREVTVVDRKDVGTPDYLDEIECQGRDCGLEVTFQLAKQLQPDSEIKDDWSPLDAYVGPGAGYFTGHEGSLGTSAESSIDFHGMDYGALDDHLASELMSRKQRQAEAEWNALSDDEKEAVSIKALYGEGATVADEDDRDILLEAGKKEWLQQKDYDIQSEVREMREKARTEAVAAMRRDLEAAVAADTIECCLQLYRGLEVDPHDIDQMISDGYVVHGGVNSWTTSRGVARSFGANRLLLVTRKPRVGHVFSSNAHEEMEVIRPPSRMRILGVVRTKTGTVLHVDEDEDYKGL